MRRAWELGLSEEDGPHSVSALPFFLTRACEAAVIASFVVFVAGWFPGWDVWLGSRSWPSCFHAAGPFVAKRTVAMFVSFAVVPLIAGMLMK